MRHYSEEDGSEMWWHHLALRYHFTFAQRLLETSLFSAYSDGQCKFNDDHSFTIVHWYGVDFYFATKRVLKDDGAWIVPLIPRSPTLFYSLLHCMLHCTWGLQPSEIPKSSRTPRGLHRSCTLADPLPLFKSFWLQEGGQTVICFIWAKNFS